MLEKSTLYKKEDMAALTFTIKLFKCSGEACIGLPSYARPFAPRVPSFPVTGIGGQHILSQSDLLCHTYDTLLASLDLGYLFVGGSSLSLLTCTGTVTWWGCGSLRLQMIKAFHHFCEHLHHLILRLTDSCNHLRWM